LGLRSFGPVHDLELHRLALAQGPEARRLDGREVDEDIRAVFLLDEAVTLRVVEPLDFAGYHGSFPLSFELDRLKPLPKAKGE